MSFGICFSANVCHLQEVHLSQLFMKKKLIYSRKSKINNPGVGMDIEITETIAAQFERITCRDSVWAA